MAGGEVCKLTFSKVAEPAIRAVRTDVPAFSQNECCFKLPVFGDAFEPDNDLKNDRHSVIGKYDKNFYSTVSIILQKYEAGNWVDKVLLVDDTYGTNYSYGTLTSSDGNTKYVAYLINWYDVLFTPALGEGTYRFKFFETDFNLNTTDSFYPFEFCVKAYLPHRANRTVRFDWYQKGYIGDWDDDNDIWDFTKVAKDVGGEGWFNQMRLPDSFFGDNKSEYERQYIRYANGQQVYIQDEQVESYEFHSGMFPAEMHSWIKTNIIQADRIIVSDFNKANPNIITEKAVKPSGNYEPSWNYNNLRAFVSVPFVQEFQNRRKTRC